MKLLIHTPISNRAWVLPEFLEALLAQDITKSETVVCFDVNESDDATRPMLEDFARRMRGIFADVLVREMKWQTALRMPDHQWNTERYRRMIQMRNGALYAADKLGVEHLFSLDSDVIMKDPDTISHLIQANTPIIAAVFMAVWGNPDARALPNVWQCGQNDMTDEFIDGIAKASQHVRVGGLGAITLIRHEVWKAGVNYSPLYNLPRNYRGEDRYFCIRAVAAEFRLMACAHKRIEHRERPQTQEIKP